MDYKPEIMDVDLVVEPMPYTIEDRSLISSLIREYKKTGEVSNFNIELVNNDTEIKSELELKAAFNTLNKLIAEMGDDTDKQTQAKVLAEAIQSYEKKYVSFPVG